jgi:hypothetical protein
LNTSGKNKDMENNMPTKGESEIVMSDGGRAQSNIESGKLMSSGGNKNIFKSIGAVVAGFIVVFILSVATDAVLEKIGVFPPQTNGGLFVPWMLALALAYRIVYTVLGGYVAAKLAPTTPMRHALILGAIGFVAAAIGFVVNADKSQAWYPIALIVTALPCTWLGGKLVAVRKPEVSTAQ